MEQRKAKFVLRYPSTSNQASSRDEVPSDIKAVCLLQVGSHCMVLNQIFVLLFFSVKLFDFEVIGELV